MATSSSILAWRIPWTEEPRGLWSIKSQSWTHQGIFPTQGLNPGLLCCRQILYHLTKRPESHSWGGGDAKTELLGERREEEEEEDMAFPTIPLAPTEPSPMPDPCSGDLDAVMLGKTLSLQACRQAVGHTYNYHFIRKYTNE